MYFYNLMIDMSKNKNVDLYVDMDGVIAEYGINKNNPYDYLNKRPLNQNIKTLEEVSKIEGVNLFILSVCREDNQIEEKNKWLDKNAPFFKKENRRIISRSSREWNDSKTIKVDFLLNVESENQIAVLDDDNAVLREIKEKIKTIIVMQDSELID